MLSDFYYEKLNETDKKLYQCIVYALNKDKSKIKLSQVPEQHVIETILAEHPELFVYNLRDIEYLTGSFGAISDIRYACEKTIASSVIKTAKSLAFTLKSGSEERTARNIHNYMVRHIRYDYAVLQSNMYDHTTHSLIGPILENRGVCEGIALTFKYLANEVGLDCATVTGRIKGNESLHMWNVISINGRHYHVDVTQDISNTDSRWGKPSYLFYLLTDKEMGKTHIWDNSFDCEQVIDNPFDNSDKSFSNTFALINYLKGIKPEQRLVYFKYTGNLATPAVTKLVTESLNWGISYRRLSVTNNADIFYYFKEV